MSGFESNHVPCESKAVVNRLLLCYCVRHVVELRVGVAGYNLACVHVAR